MELSGALTALAVAVAAGGLIGAERQRAQENRADFGGIRAFPLLAIAGVLAALLRPVLGAWSVAALLGAVVVALAVSQAKTKSDNRGVAGEIAAIVTFGLGVLSATPELLPDSSRYLLVVGIAATTMALLALKRPLHGFVALVSEDDVYATVKFVLLGAVVLPLLPDHPFGPLAVLNPRKIGWMIALVAGVSFAGYVAARLVGSRRGLLVAGVLGGLVSSTALTVALSTRAKAQPALTQLCGVSIIAGCATMFPRVLLVVAIAYLPLLRELALPFGAMAVVSYGTALFYYFRGGARDSREDVPFKNPFELSESLKFGVIYAIVLLVSRAAQIYVGTSGVYASAALAGIADVDAITLSLAELERSHALEHVAAAAITLAALVNTVVKAVLAALLGGRALGKQVMPTLLGTAAVGLLALILNGLSSR